MLDILINRAQALKNELDALRPLAPEVEARVMQKLRIDWNYHSNNIEGNSLTYGETKALLLYGMTAKGKPLSDHVEISGHQAAIAWLLDMVRKKEELTGYFVRRLHEIIFGEQLNTKIQVGAYKENPNYLIAKSGETINFATPEETPAKMQDLLDQFNKNEADSEVNPILLAAAFHHQFVLIHPFEDGNGRMSRLLMNFILMRAGYPPAVIKTDEKEAYYTALQLSDAEGNSLPLAEYLASAVIASLELMLKGARGESIEEPSDLDKQLAMLEAELTQKGTKFNIAYSKETKENWMHNIYPILINKIEEINNKFARFYTKYTIKEIDKDSILTINSSFSNFNRRLANDKLNRAYNYTNFIVISLEHYKYVVRNAQNIFSNYYDELPTPAQLNLLANNISDEHLKIISTYKETGKWEGINF